MPTGTKKTHSQLYPLSLVDFLRPGENGSLQHKIANRSTELQSSCPGVIDAAVANTSANRKSTVPVIDYRLFPAPAR